MTLRIQIRKKNDKQSIYVLTFELGRLPKTSDTGSYHIVSQVQTSLTDRDRFRFYKIRDLLIAELYK